MSPRTTAIYKFHPSRYVWNKPKWCRSWIYELLFRFYSWHEASAEENIRIFSAMLTWQRWMSISNWRKRLTKWRDYLDQLRSSLGGAAELQVENKELRKRVQEQEKTDSRLKEELQEVKRRLAEQEAISINLLFVCLFVCLGFTAPQYFIGYIAPVSVVNVRMSAHVGSYHLAPSNSGWILLPPIPLRVRGEGAFQDCVYQLLLY